MKNLIKIFGVLATVLVLNCSSENTLVPTSSGATAPDIQGVWQGVLTSTTYYKTDSLDFRYAQTRITFDDSTWQYYHILPNGDKMNWYQCNSEMNRYYVTVTSLHLDDRCPYLAIVDGRIMFWPDYSFSLNSERLILQYSIYDSSMGLEIQQLIDLRRVSD